jgi:hypothetical protein
MFYTAIPFDSRKGREAIVAASLAGTKQTQCGLAAGSAGSGSTPCGCTTVSEVT